MRYRPRHSAHRTVLLVATLLILITGSPARGTDAGQGQPDQIGSPITPAPFECTVRPRPVQELIQLGALPGTPAAAEIDIASTEPAPAPAGRPADVGTTSAVIAVVRQYVACLNAFDTPRSFALFTDSHLAETLYDFGPLPGLTLSAGQASIVLPEDAWRSFAVASVTLLPDGRAAAVVNVLTPTSSSGFPPGQVAQVIYVLAQTNGAWRIDESITDNRNRGNEIVAGANFAGVIFNVPSAEGLVEYFGDTGRYGEFWYPTRRHIFALESALLAFLASQSSPLADRTGRKSICAST